MNPTAESIHGQVCDRYGYPLTARSGAQRKVSEHAMQLRQCRGQTHARAAEKQFHRYRDGGARRTITVTDLRLA
jgi:hypothetical protein